jgi:hypothetical protein
MAIVREASEKRQVLVDAALAALVHLRGSFAAHLGLKIRASNGDKTVAELSAPNLDAPS